jgi:hypothetical protein
MSIFESQMLRPEVVPGMKQAHDLNWDQIQQHLGLYAITMRAGQGEIVVYCPASVFLSYDVINPKFNVFYRYILNFFHYY